MMTYVPGDASPWDFDDLLGRRLSANSLQLPSGDLVDPPVSNLAYAAGSAGTLTGGYKYTVSFVTANGETPPWVGTPATVTLAAQRMNLSSIPIGPAGTISRRIYRSIANEAQDKRYYFLTEVSDNTTTTYVDNATDASLGASVNWIATNRGDIYDGSTLVAAFSGLGQSVAIGGGGLLPGYASVAIGYQSQQNGKAGLRNTSVGVYAMQNVTLGYRNTCFGTYAGNGITTGASNTCIGYLTGGTGGIVTGNFNVLIGDSAGGSTTLTGNGNVAIGYLALALGSGTVSYNIAIGANAGRYSSANFQFFLDPFNVDRGSEVAQKANGLDWGLSAATPKDQRRQLNSLVRIGGGDAPLVSDLPAASSALKGYRGYVTDAFVAYTSANIGSTVVGGGSNCVPVFCTGANWVIG